VVKFTNLSLFLEIIGKVGKIIKIFIQAVKSFDWSKIESISLCKVVTQLHSILGLILYYLLHIEQITLLFSHFVLIIKFFLSYNIIFGKFLSKIFLSVSDIFEKILKTQIVI